MASIRSSKVKILLLNPNCSSDMTQGMEAAAKKVQSDMVSIDTYTAPPSAPDSINDDHDIQASTKAVLADLESSSSLKLSSYNAILVACFSVHTLVTELATKYPALVVTGIFEASVLTSLSLLPAHEGAETWGIVTTGKFWEQHLSDGARSLLGQSSSGSNSKFAGVFSTGLNAGDFHRVSPEQVRAKLGEATTKLLNTGKVTCVVMGCGGMAGLEDIIRSTAAEVYGQDAADRLYIIDGVKAGVLQLEQAVQARRAFV